MLRLIAIQSHRIDVAPLSDELFSNVELIGVYLLVPMRLIASGNFFTGSLNLLHRIFEIAW